MTVTRVLHQGQIVSWSPLSVASMLARGVRFTDGAAVTRREVVATARQRWAAWRRWAFARRGRRFACADRHVVVEVRGHLPRKVAEIAEELARTFDEAVLSATPAQRSSYRWHELRPVEPVR